jgi:hypothetical protein
MLKDSIDVGDYITKKFDYVIKSDLYKSDGKCLIYDFIRKITLDETNKIQRPLITLSPDISISSATLSGNAERHLNKNGVTHQIKENRVDGMEFGTDLKVLYISSKLSLNTDIYEGLHSYQKSIMSNALGLTKESFTGHNITLNSKNIIYLGIKEDLIEESEQSVLDSFEDKPLVFTLQDVQKKGITRIMKFIFNKFKSHKIHVVMDLSATSYKIAPSVFRFRFEEDGSKNENENENENNNNNNNNNKNKESALKGFEYSDVMEIMKTVVLFKEAGNLEGFDLTGYSFSTEEFRAKLHSSNMITSKLMIDILKCISDFTEYTINIFDEDSKFLIWKKVPLVSPIPETMDNVENNLADDPIGWCILRNINMQSRNDFISHFEKEKLKQNTDHKSDKSSIDKIKLQLEQLEYPIEMFEFEDDNGDPLNVFISVTSCTEQNLKSYYTAVSYVDRCLMPNEKVSMTFELLATPEAIKALNIESEYNQDNQDNKDNKDNKDGYCKYSLNECKNNDCVIHNVHEIIDEESLRQCNELYKEYNDKIIRSR